MGDKKRVKVEIKTPEKVGDEDSGRSRKMFSPKWLEMDIMKRWLVPHSDSCKAKCIACNKVLNAGKSELLKHASGSKHTQNLKLLENIGFGISSQQNTQSALDALTASLAFESPVPISPATNANIVFLPQIVTVENETQTSLSGGDSLQAIYQEKQIEVLSRIANAVERLANCQEALAASKSLQKNK